jgi:hypothetical protein
MLQVPRLGGATMNRSVAGLSTRVLLCAVLFVAGTRTAHAAGVVGTGTALSCTDTALDAALAGGGLVTFNCGGPAMIDIGSAKTIAADTTVDGGGLITISGGFPAFDVGSGVELSVRNLRIAGGSVGVSAQDGGSLIVTGSEFVGITGTGPFGQGISMAGRGMLRVSDSTFTRNTTGIGLTGNGPLQGSATVISSTFADNDAGNRDGGGIENVGWTLAVTNSTFVGNSAGAGGGIENAGGTLTVVNSTFSGNSGQVGGAINNIIEDGAGLMTVTNSIFSSNLGDSCSGLITDGGHNLDDGTTCGFSVAKGSLVNTSPQLDPAGLQFNGGPTQTVALCTAVDMPPDCTGASPAIDAGDDSICAAAPVNNRDQRGFVRPGSGHTHCSIGAYEAGAVAPAQVCVGDCNGNGQITIDDALTLVNIALGNPGSCPNGVPAGATVDIALIIQAVNNALNGCPARVCGGIAGLTCGAGAVCDLRDPTCSVADLTGMCVPGPLPCPLGGDPVCGCDGVTYANDCTRVSAAATLAHAGACAGKSTHPSVRGW